MALPLVVEGVIAALTAPIISESVGYAWHRTAEHAGYLGNKVRFRHWTHHEVHYPATALRPEHPKKYKDAGSWTWYIVGVIATAIIFWLLPLHIGIPFIIVGWLYSVFLVEYFHRAFHVRGHWLHRFAWFNKLMLLHDVHHYGPYNYGIVFFWMDRLFGTFRTSMPSAQEERFPGFVPPHTHGR